jgi:hypothetical protein
VQEFPKCRHHYSGKNVTVNNAAEEAALGGGWADSPVVFNRYKGPRSDTAEQYDPCKWVDEWPIVGLSDSYRMKIRGQLLRVHASFWRSPDAPNAAIEAMKSAVNSIAKTLLDAGVLNQVHLKDNIPLLVWDSAIAGGWWRLGSDTPHEMFPEHLGHYWV